VRIAAVATGFNGHFANPCTLSHVSKPNISTTDRFIASRLPSDIESVPQHSHSVSRIILHILSLIYMWRRVRSVPSLPVSRHQ
jgi:hypothetical protein